MESKTVFLSLGSNIDDRLAFLQKSTDTIRDTCGNVVALSSVYETEPWGFQSFNSFLNQVIALKTDLSPSGLMEQLLTIEKHFGRERGLSNTYQSRTVDIDILYFDNMIINTALVSVPHPRLHLRKFVLVPLCEIAPEFIHPVFNCSNSELLNKLADSSAVRPFLFA